MAPGLLPKPHDPSSEILKPPLPTTPVPTTPQLAPVLPARIELATCTVVSVARIAAPALELPLLLFANVLLVTVPPCPLSIAPPAAETLPEKVQLVTASVPAGPPL